jgi:redox-sensitive bicupin YhaK (pirin superfamily)
MLKIRPARERGHANHGWLDTWHTFSFADYYDAEHESFRDLRVINEDVVEAGAGFPRHGHRDMEILTWILAGALEHKDSMGSGGIIKPGEMQYMSAGSGVLHSEFNASKSERVHLLQIWIIPSVAGAKPRYSQQDFGAALARGGLVKLASPEGDGGSIAVRQDVALYAARPLNEQPLVHELAPGRAGWLQVARGRLRVNDVDLGTGDGLAIENERKLTIQAQKGAEFLLFDLA